MKEEVKARKQEVFGFVGVIMVAIFALVLAGAIDTAEARGGYKRFCNAGKKWYKQYHKKHKKHIETITPQCGDTIKGEGRHLRLKADLDCSHLDPETDPGFEAALTIYGPVTLDLRGHSIIGNSNMDFEDDPAAGEIDGILIMDEMDEMDKKARVRISNGTVTGFYNGVVLGGNGHHRVFKMKAVENEEYGFAAYSDNNRLTFNRARDNGDNGFYFMGDGNWFVKNRAIRNGDEGFFGPSEAGQNKIYLNRAIDNAEDGIQVVGDENRVIHNYARENGYRYDNYEKYPNKKFDGFEIDGNYNFVYKNKSFNNSHNGFELDGTGNKIIKNRVRHNPEFGIFVEDKSDVIENVVAKNVFKKSGLYDIYEESGDYERNTWEKNRFETSYPEYIE